MFRNMPFILVLTIVAIVILNPFVSLPVKQFLYSLSLSIKEVIIFFLPFIIFGLLFKAALNLAQHSTKIFLIIIGAVCCSNFVSTYLSHFVGQVVYNFDLSNLSTAILNHGLETIWNFSLPKIIANHTAMFSGIILGLITSKISPNQGMKLAIRIESLVNKLLSAIVYLIPIFVVGFIVKLQHDGVIAIILKDYLLIFAFVAMAQFSYILGAYLVLNKAKLSPFFSI
jgi:hypothetical protein